MKNKKIILIPLLALALTSCSIEFGDKTSKETVKSTFIPSESVTIIPNEPTSTSNMPTTVPSESTSASSKPTTVPSEPTSTSSKPTTPTTSTLPASESTNQNKLNAVFKGYNEGAYITANLLPNTTSNDYKAYYKTANSDFISIDNELIREIDGKIRVDIVGLKKGDYTLKIETTKAGNNYQATNTVTVTSHDRSGYAHFNNSGIGSYNDDGSLKNNTTVVYVTDKNKNTVTANIGGKERKGLAEILRWQSTSDKPLNIRIIGKIDAATWKELKYNKTSVTPDQVIGVNNKPLPKQKLKEADIISGGYNTLDTSKYSKLNGLTNIIKYDSKKMEFDSYYNMLEVEKAQNVTIEGIGTDAKIFQWGFTWKNCSSIEVRNITFEDNPEDACSFEGSETSAKTIADFKTGRIWIHNNTFLEGKNYWDVCNEQDKHEGDGSVDLKGLAYITLSYNHFYKNHKTGLVGGSDSQGTACITYHHNYYEENVSRLPLGRNANMHMYNNYYYSSTGQNMSLRAGAYALIEGCMFENCNKAIELKAGTSVTGSSLDASAKLYQNEFINCNGVNGKIVTTRDELIKNQNPYAKDFDTNSQVFYYDSVNKKSNVSYLTDALTAKNDCINNSGVLK